eukprot:CAMPEP_0196760398 /NCGR_PEP_ID=MMETSP1091-20130531/105199_1 /TAXON_ID=302021 /ORGANISM="Rhodomonas sp., Strain CCMP768" /LENGTH=93 /DNA_ID=CAMNT_0042109283 /DNA_START=457 /DNA_END=739 /DNA_ORIENTATION=+
MTMCRKVCGLICFDFAGVVAPTLAVSQREEESGVQDWVGECAEFYEDKRAKIKADKEEKKWKTTVQAAMKSHLEAQFNFDDENEVQVKRRKTR